MVENVLQKVGNTISDIKTHFDKVEHVLVHIYDTITNYNGVSDYVCREIANLEATFVSDDYINAFNDCFRPILNEQANQPKGELVKKMITLVKDSCINQLEMETI